MIQIFDKIKTECAVCKTPLNGENLLKRGNRYYCQADYDRTSPEEKQENKRMIKESEWLQNLLRENE